MMQGIRLPVSYDAVRQAHYIKIYRFEVRFT